MKLSRVPFVLYVFGRQILQAQADVDESKIKGPNRCASNFECSTGRICVNTWCQYDIISKHQGTVRANVDHPYNEMHNSKRVSHRSGGQNMAVERYQTVQVHNESDGVFLLQKASSNLESLQEKSDVQTATQQGTAQTSSQPVKLEDRALERKQVSVSLSHSSKNSTSCLAEELQLNCDSACLLSVSPKISNFDASPNFDIEATFSLMIDRSAEPHPCMDRIYQANNYSSFIGACRHTATIQAGSVLLVYACLTDDTALDPLERERTRSHFSGFIASHYPADSLVGRAEYIRPAETADLHDDNAFNYRADRPKNRWSRSLPIDFDRDASARVGNFTCHAGGRNGNQLSKPISYSYSCDVPPKGGFVFMIPDIMLLKSSSNFATMPGMWKPPTRQRRLQCSTVPQTDSYS